VGLDNQLRLYGGDSTDPDKPGATLHFIWFTPTHLDLACDAQSALHDSFAASFTLPTYEVDGSALGLGASVGYEMLVLDAAELAQLQAAGVSAGLACAADRGPLFASTDGGANACRWLWLVVDQPSDYSDAWLASRCSTTHTVEVLAGKRPSVRIDARQAPPGLSERVLNTVNQRATITPDPSAVIRLVGAVSFGNNALEYTSTFRAFAKNDETGEYSAPRPVLRDAAGAAGASADPTLCDRGGDLEDLCAVQSDPCALEVGETYRLVYVVTVLPDQVTTAETYVTSNAPPTTDSRQGGIVAPLTASALEPVLIRAEGWTDPDPGVIEGDLEYMFTIAPVSRSLMPSEPAEMRRRDASLRRAA